MPNHLVRGEPPLEIAELQAWEEDQGEEGVFALEELDQFDQHGSGPGEHLPDPNGRAAGLLKFRRLGSSAGVARGDFNGDGFADLAVGVPQEDVTSGKSAFSNAGVVNVIYGSADGLVANSPSVPVAQVWHQNVFGLADLVESGDRFGAALAAGDFNGDGNSDLAIGVPGEKNPAGERVGGVHVLYGSGAGLTTTGDQLFLANASSSQPSSPVFPSSGLSLGWGDFNGDGYGDLSIEARGANSAFNTASLVRILLGSAGGLSTSGQQLISLPTDVGLITESGYLVDLALSAGDFNQDGRADLVVGARFGVVGNRSAGKVLIFPGVSPTGVGTSSQVLSQPLTGSNLDEIAESGDSFGAALAVGDFDGDTFPDLAVGVPGEDNGRIGEIAVPNAISNGGSVDVFYGAGGVLTVNNRQIIYDFVVTVGNGGPGPGQNDRLGTALAAGDFDHDGFKDLAIGAPGETLSGAASAGAVEVFYGEADGLAGPPQFWHEGNVNQGGAPTAGDRFGETLTAWNFGKNQSFFPTPTDPGFTLFTADLAIGVAFKEVVNTDKVLVNDAGLVRVLYGSIDRLSAGVVFAPQTWHQDRPGVPDAVESNDRFGEALY
ncbi:MAG: hypothetical protein AB9869_09650 [Verrucomicrobiia bacterium]